MTEISHIFPLFSHLNPSVQDFLRILKREGGERNVPNISWSTAQGILHSIEGLEIKNILEIGPANGFSTIMLALGNPNSDITSVEISRHAFEELRHNLTTFYALQKGSEGEGIPANFDRKVTSDIFQGKIGNISLYFGDAREVLPCFQTGKKELSCDTPKSILKDIPQKTFDIIFIDGAFRMTREFYDLSVPLLSPGGIIIIDDVIKYRWKMDGFYEYLDSLGVKYEVIQTDPDDGIMVIKKEKLVES